MCRSVQASTLLRKHLSGSARNIVAVDVGSDYAEAICWLADVAPQRFWQCPQLLASLISNEQEQRLLVKGCLDFLGRFAVSPHEVGGPLEFHLAGCLVFFAPNFAAALWRSAMNSLWFENALDTRAA
jgi:hypothetical protein